MKHEQSASIQKGWSTIEFVGRNSERVSTHQRRAGNHQDNPQAGFSPVEILLAISIFSLLVTAVVGALIYGMEATTLSSRRVHAILLAEEGLEATRNIRDAQFDNLQNGTHGLAISRNQWIFSGTQDTSDIFTRSIVITSDAKRKHVAATVTWQQNLQRTGSVTLVTYLTDWLRTAGQADALVIDTTNAVLAAGNKELRDITLQNTDETDIVIDNITVAWNNPNLIEEIRIDNTKIWSKNGPGTPPDKQPSGTELDIQDFTLEQNANTLSMDKIKFDGNMSGATFNITFQMEDGSTKSTGDFSP